MRRIALHTSTVSSFFFFLMKIKTGIPELPIYSSTCIQTARQILEVSMHYRFSIFTVISNPEFVFHL